MINFATENVRWVLRRYCEEFSSRIPESTIGVIDNNADVNLFFPYYTYSSDCTTPSIGFFTHFEQDTEEKVKAWHKATESVDWCVAMCGRTASYLPQEKTSIIQVYPDKQFYKDRLVLGVAGKECPSGRKRFELVEQLRQIHGVSVLFADGVWEFENMPNFYKQIDYLVITADNEGGPMPVIEALAMGKPVIAPDVGFAWNYPVLRYNNPEDLMKLVKGLVLPRNGWDIATGQLLDIVEKVKIIERVKHDKS
jgi:glycosyltransferase involved in cell wall biosynthesis